MHVLYVVQKMCIYKPFVEHKSGVLISAASKILELAAIPGNTNILHVYQLRRMYTSFMDARKPQT